VIYEVQYGVGLKGSQKLMGNHVQGVT